MANNRLSGGLFAVLFACGAAGSAVMFLPEDRIVSNDGVSVTAIVHNYGPVARSVVLEQYVGDGAEPRQFLKARRSFAIPPFTLAQRIQMPVYRDARPAQFDLKAIR